MGREGFGAATVELDARDVVQYDASRLHSKFGVRRADLKDEVGLFNGMASKHGTLLLAVV